MSAMSTAGAPKQQRIAATLILASIGTFLTSLDIVVVSTALPTLQSDLGATLTDLEWTINAYNLSFAALMLTAAAVADRFGRRKLFVIGLVLFALASIGCASADTAGMLIGWRAVQGVGAAIVLPLSLTLISEAFPIEKRGMAIGIWGGINGLGVALAPLIGGAILEGINWQWIFWINVPVCLVAAVLSQFMLTESRGPRPRLDLVGLPLIALGLLALVWAPVRAPEAGWGSAEVIGGFIVGVAFIAAFVWWESRAKMPMIPLEYFKLRSFNSAGAVAFLFWFALIGTVFWCAQMLQQGLGYSPLESGVRMLVFTMPPMIFAPIGGLWSDRIGTRPVMSLGLLLMGGGYIWLGLLTEEGVTYTSLIAPFIVAGIGIALVFPTMANASIAAVPLRDSGVASGSNNTLREAGGLFGIAVLAAVFTSNGSFETQAEFMNGVRYTLLVAAAVGLVSLIPALMGPSRAQMLASAEKANRVPDADAEPVLAPVGD